MEIDFADYHSKQCFKCTETLYKAYQKSSNLNTPSGIFEILDALIIDDESASTIKKQKFAAEAHLLAFAHNLHTVGDLLAKALNLAIFDDLADVKLYKVRDKIASKEPDLSKAISDLLYADCFKYLNAFTNVTKHHSLISTKHTANFDTKQLGLKIESFEYYNRKNKDKEHWDVKWVDSFLRDDYTDYMKRFGAIGSCLLDYYKKKII